MSRIEASDLLMGERECGTFLIRDSLSIQGDYVLCVRYVIYKLFKDNRIFLILLQNTFPHIGQVCIFAVFTQCMCHFSKIT